MPRTHNPHQQKSAGVEPMISTRQAELPKLTTCSRIAKLVETDNILHPNSLKESELPLAKPKAKGNNLKHGNDNVEGQSLPTPGQTRSPQAKLRPCIATEGPVEKRKRHTKAEILADKAKAQEQKVRLEEEVKRNEEQMMRMDIDEDNDRAKAAARTIQNFADMENDSGLEEFPGYDDVGSDSDSNSESESEGDSVDEKATKQSIQQGKKRVGGGGGGQKKGLGGKKTTTSQTVTYASGLRKDWNKQTAQKKPSVQISAGGLEDSDIEDVNPYTSQSKSSSTRLTVTITEEDIANGTQQTKRDLTHKNEMVLLVTDDDESDFIPPPITKKAAANVRRPATKVDPNPKSKPARHQIIDDGDRSSQLPVKPIAPKPRHGRLNGNNVCLADLPEFASQKWRNTFLPTLYNKFFTSDEPFDAFNSGSDHFIALLQVIVGEVYPDVKYTVMAADAIHFLTPKRKEIGFDGRDIPTVPFFSKTPLLKDLLSNKVTQVISAHTEASQFPSGRMLSPFILDLAKSFLTLSKGSASENGFPKILFALIMAALERAVLHLAKPSTQLSEFSKPQWGSQIGIYYRGCNNVPDDCWEELVGICSGKVLEDSDGNCSDADLSLLDNNRAFIFGFSSPAKPCA